MANKNLGSTAVWQMVTKGGTGPKARNEGEGRTRPHAEMRGKGEATRARDETEPSLSILPRQRWHVCPSKLQLHPASWRRLDPERDIIRPDQTRRGTVGAVASPSSHGYIQRKKMRMLDAQPANKLSYKVYNIYILSIDFL